MDIETMSKSINDLNVSVARLGEKVDTNTKALDNVQGTFEKFNETLSNFPEKMKETFATKDEVEAVVSFYDTLRNNALKYIIVIVLLSTAFAVVRNPEILKNIFGL